MKNQKYTTDNLVNDVAFFFKEAFKPLQPTAFGRCFNFCIIIFLGLCISFIISLLAFTLFNWLGFPILGALVLLLVASLCAVLLYFYCIEAGYSEKYSKLTIFIIYPLMIIFTLVNI